MSATGFLHRSGIQLLDSNGNSVSLRGMGLGGLTNAMDNFNQYNFTKAALQTLKNNGANITELDGLDWSRMEPGNGVFATDPNTGTSWLVYLDQYLAWAQEVGIYLIITLGVTGVKGPSSYAPSWITGVTGDHSLDEIAFFDINNSYGLQSQGQPMRTAFAAYAAMLVNRVNTVTGHHNYENPYFLLDFDNEPFNGNTNGDYNSSNATLSADYAATIAWLLTQVPNYANPLWVDEPWCNGGLGSPTSIGNVNMVWETHDYSNDGDGSPPTPYDNWLAHVQWDYDRYVTGLGFPLFIGEWACVTTAFNADDTAAGGWSSQQSTLTTMINYMNSQIGIIGHDWWVYGVLPGGLYAVSGYGYPPPSSGHCYTPDEATWLLENVMVGGGPPPITPGGTTSPTPGNYSEPANSSVSVTAVPNPGYQLAYWLLDGANVGSANPYLVTMNQAHTLEAAFQVIPTVALNVVAGSNGSVTPSGSQTLTVGNNYAFSATANPGYLFSYWNLNGTNISTSSKLNLTATSAMNGETLTAYFIAGTVTISVVAGPNGSVSPSGIQNLTVGQTYPFTATPAPEYAFSYWDLAGTSISTSASITLTASSSINGETLTAHFVQTQINLTVAAGANGTVSLAGSQVLTIGQSYSYTAVPANGYQLDHWDLSGSSQGSTNPLPLVASLAMNGETLTAVFTATPPVQITLNIATTGNGSTNLQNGPHTFNVGTNVTFTAVAQPQYAFSQWTLGAATYPSNPLSLPIIQAMNGETLTAVFIETTVTITVAAGANGSVTPVGSETLNIGQAYLFSATPAPGYQLDHWDLSGSSQGSNNPLTLTATANMNGENLTAIFSVLPPQTITLTVAAGANGSVSPSGPQTLTVGKSYQYIATAAAGYVFNYWNLNGANISIANPISLTASSTINGEILTAEFVQAEIQLTVVPITLTVTSNGTASPSGPQTLVVGQTYPFAAIPAGGYQLDHWDLNGLNLGSTNPLSLVATLAMNGETLTAVFTAIPPVQISINIATSGNGSVNLANGAHTFNVGDTVTFTAIPQNSQNAFNQWTLGQAIYPSNPLSIQIAASMNGATLTAVFVKTAVTITIAAGANGSVTPTGSTILNIGQSYLFSATSDPDYVLDHWDLSGTSKGSSNPLTIVATLAMDGEMLTAIFAQAPPQTITMNLTSSSGGTTDIAAGSQTFNVGDTVTITALPNSGSSFINWTLNGTVYSAANPLSLPITVNLNGATLTANFKTPPPPANSAIILLGSAGAIALIAALA